MKKSITGIMQSQQFKVKCKTKIMLALCLVHICFTSINAQVAPNVNQQASVIVEGNCSGKFNDNGEVTQPTVTPGSCGDYDYDGRIGAAEDADGDEVYGSILAAIQNNDIERFGGEITIVTSGRFDGDIVYDGGLGGKKLTLQAAPGVRAVIEQLRARSTVREELRAGILIVGQSGQVRNTVVPPSFVTLRNLTVRGFTNGMVLTQLARVLIDNCNIENSLQHGVLVSTLSDVTINNSKVYDVGQRLPVRDPVTNAVVANAPGDGIKFADGVEDGSTGMIVSSVISGNRGAAISNPNANNVCVYETNTFANGQPYSNVRWSLSPCGSGVKVRTNLPRLMPR